MRLGLINPRGIRFFESKDFLSFWQDSYDVKYYKKAWSGMSTGLLAVASLTPASFEIRIIDENFDAIDYDEEFDIIGISAMTQQATRAYEIADKFRENGRYVIMGGIHATVLPNEAIMHVDTIIIGEAEELWPEFIRDFLNGTAKQIYRNSDSKGIDIKKSPIPRFDLLKAHNYETIWPQTTRGCPHKCEFCIASNIHGTRYRHKTVEQIINELEVIKGLWKNPTICFADDNMFVNRKFAKELIKAFIPLNLSWMAQTDISIGNDEELLELLYRSGCEVVYIGLESVSEENLHLIDPANWKMKQLHKYPALLGNIQSHGIGVHGSFMVGLDNDDLSTFQSIIDFIIDNNLFGGSISILAPYPGSKIRERFEKEGRLLHTPWSDYNGGKVTFLPKQLTPRQLHDGLIKIWRNIYAPEIQIRKMRYFKNVFKKLRMEKKNHEGTYN